MRLKLKRCTFRTKYYGLRFGGSGGHGTSHQWLGIALEVFGK